jgi:hypothetical protein
MAILSKGTDFSTGDQVTAAKLDALVDNATFASDAVDDSTTALDSNGKIIVKDAGITSAKLNLSATGASQTIASFKTTQDGQNRSLDINTPASTTDLTSPFELATGNAILFQIDPEHSILFDSDGKVGIGTTSPSEELHVSGSTGDPSILLENTSTGSSDDTIIRSRIGGTTARNFIYFGDSADDNAGQIAYYHDGNSMRFTTNATEAMRITSSGGLLVGRTTSTATAEDNGLVLSGSGLIMVSRDGTSSDTHMQFINNAAVDATVVGSITTSGSATAFNTSSDYRLKEDILEIQDSISKVQALKPVNFAWKLDGTRADGFLAHEAQEVVPAAVSGTKDAVDEDGQPDYQGIDQSKLVPLLTKALQEALTKIESLEARVTALES